MTMTVIGRLSPSHLPQGKIRKLFIFSLLQISAKRYLGEMPKAEGVGLHHPGERTRALSPWADGVGLPRHTTSECNIFNICSIFRQVFNERKITPRPERSRGLGGAVEGRGGLEGVKIFANRAG
jgi:hypothetical protein